MAAPEVVAVSPTKPMLAETDLYSPIKAWLEALGYEVKAEVGAADVVAQRGDQEPLIVELKTGFSLALVHQGIERQKLPDWVYLAVPRGSGRRWQAALKANKGLCRRLGLGRLLCRQNEGHSNDACQLATTCP